MEYFFIWCEWCSSEICFIFYIILTMSCIRILFLVEVVCWNDQHAAVHFNIYCWVDSVAWSLHFIFYITLLFSFNYTYTFSWVLFFTHFCVCSLSYPPTSLPLPASDACVMPYIICWLCSLSLLLLAWKLPHFTCFKGKLFPSFISWYAYVFNVKNFSCS